MSDYYFIKGVGIDIVEISRITDTLQNKLINLEMIFTKNEINRCLVNKNRFTTFALIYAAKQATIKALGKCGKLIPLNKIEVHNINKELSWVSIDKGWCQRVIPGQKLVINLSLSTYTDFAMAQATLYTRKILKGRIYRRTLTSNYS